ncbi:hypothetical protein GCM10027321_45410 [Massilia terrae]|uniref:Uncharacterized protein n=1 Tax=Massilia terrae TaxID=1811224 RepID=A0ABT2CYE8_9BURK|nr:hypothetical protein [Massilia terrae]MCS0659006.1 hypothetical protein [Massilia terrae]
MEQIADRRRRIGSNEVLEVDDAVPPLPYRQEKPGKSECNVAVRTSAGPRMADQAPPLRKHTSILQAERQAKIIVLTTALVAWAYFSQDFISIPEFISSIKHHIALRNPAVSITLTAEQNPAARP